MFYKMNVRNLELGINKVREYKKVVWICGLDFMFFIILRFFLVYICVYIWYVRVRGVSRGEFFIKSWERRKRFEFGLGRERCNMWV